MSGSTWVVLHHRPAAGAPTGDAVFGDPRFADHLAFVGRLAERGLLVAAGPLPDEPGTGMCLLRLPGTDGVAEARRLATDDDASVVGGLFDVDVRPWQVMVEG